MSGAKRDPDVIVLARIEVRLNFEADRLTHAKNKFIRAEGEISAVNPRSGRVSHQTAAAWRGNDSLARGLLAPENDLAHDHRVARDKAGSQEGN